MDYLFVQDLMNAKELMGCSSEAFASTIGISRATYNRWQSGQIIPDGKTMERVYSTIFEKGINLNRIYEELYLSEETKDSKILMHGSKEGLEGHPSISHSEAKKDFGNGFYVGESVKQAVSFVSSYKNPSIYFLKLENFEKLNIVEYDVSKEWMIMVAFFRGKIDQYRNSPIIQKELKKYEKADLIIAPIADNTMYSIINEFVEGSITDEQCFHCLSANRLGKQYVFLKENVLKNNLSVLRKGYICNAEKKKFEKEKMEESSVGKSKVILAKREYAGVGKYIEQLLAE